MGLNLPLLALLIPLAGAAAIAILHARPNPREAATLISAVLLFLCVLGLLPEVLAGGRPHVVLAMTLPALALTLEVEPLGLLFALIASFLWILTSIYSIGYMRGHHERNQTRFYVCFAIALASTIGVAFAGNLLTLFVFYEALTLSTYPLVTHSDDDEAKRAGRVYLGLLVGTSIGFLLIAVIWTLVVAGTLDFTRGGILAGKASPTVAGVLLVLYVFGVGKAAVMPFHRWLPAAMVAPTPVSALLHAVAVVKAGVFTLLKVAVYIFGVDFLASLGTSELLQYVAAATIVIASLVAMTKDNLKARLAYSTVSQLSYIVLGAMLGNAAGIIGGGMHIATHAFGKITLFFCAGAIMVASHKTEISEMRGLGRAMPLTFAAFFVASLSIIGLPPMGGLWSKWFLALGAMEAHQILLVGVLMLSSLLNIAYLLPIPLRAFLAASDDRSAGDGPHKAPAFCLAAILLTALGTFLLFLLPEPVYHLLNLVPLR